MVSLSIYLELLSTIIMAQAAAVKCCQKAHVLWCVRNVSYWASSPCKACGQCCLFWTALTTVEYQAMLDGSRG